MHFARINLFKKLLLAIQIRSIIKTFGCARIFSKSVTIALKLCAVLQVYFA
jgi:hypothetical protein